MIPQTQTPTTTPTLSELIATKRHQNPLHVIDPTMGASITQCARSFYLRHVLGITPIYEPEYFVAGRAWDGIKD